jgi:methyl-accepting chemotaxis protein
VDSSGNTVKNSQEQAAATQQVTATVMNMAEMAEKLMKVAQTL